MPLGIKKEILMNLYPRYESNPSYYENRIVQAKEKFIEIFGGNEEFRMFSAPGRTEIGGNHTDHQHGCVLAAAIDLDILGVARKTDTMIVKILSQGYAMETIDLTDLEIKEEEVNTSKSLIRGIASNLSKKGYKISGFDMYAVSDVLKGSGLSSSAAFEVLVGEVMNGLFCNNEIDHVEIAQIGQYAENVYFGKPSGLMDQMASSVGGVVSIDFKDTKNPVINKINFDFSKTGYALCIIDSGADHADLTDEYSAIPREMKAVANIFGKDHLREVPRELFFEKIKEVREKCGDRSVLRAIHFFDDNKKAIEEAELLQKGDFKEFLNLIKSSGFSSFMHLQNVNVNGSVENQEVAFALGLCKEFLQDRGAYRVHGGGFAGTVQAFVPNEILNNFKEAVENILGKGSCHVLSIRPVGGIEIAIGGK